MVPNAGSVFLVVLIVVAAVNGQTYCSLCRDHTMCLYQGVGSKCSPRLGGGVNRTDQAAILNAHNAYRQRVAQGQETKGSPGPQPPASNMRMMTWSTELASVAQRWADQCDFKRDKCRRVTSHPSVGQAIYRSSFTGGGAPVPDWEDTITVWYDYVKHFNKNHVSPFVWNGAGLYSQIVWAETHKVGCGYTTHKDPGDREWTHQSYVCNYGPGGNMVGATLYKKGQACAKCPAGTSCSDSRFPGLCA